MSDRKTHWEDVYRGKAAHELAWFQPRAGISLDLIAAAGIPNAAVIDMGAGASRLVDDLVAAGFVDVTVVDIAEAALAQARARLGERAERINWITADATEVELPRQYDIWHDRAVFHFLMEDADREAYLERLGRFLKVGGQAIIAAFAPDGPDKCSGLPVRQYDEQTLAAILGPNYTLIETRREMHSTPAGIEQAFVYCRFEKRA
ncbi:MAG TPA: class I SAM-dependent methyltransferase [Thioalkalivibrio sp.]|nr:class I SAM-dependent methyltransferase [Thioalkalivibrio sp.]